MSKLKVGGMLGKYKTLAQAVNKAHNGDTIILNKKRNVLERGLLVDKELYIEGNGAIIVPPQNNAAFALSGNGHLELDGISFEIYAQSNAISSVFDDEHPEFGFNGTIVLKHGRMYHHGKIDPHEIFPSLALQKANGVLLTLDDYGVDYGLVIADKLVMHGGTLGSIFMPQSIINVSRQLQVDGTILENAELINNTGAVANIEHPLIHGGTSLVGSYNLNAPVLSGLVDYSQADNVSLGTKQEFKNNKRHFALTPVQSNLSVSSGRKDSDGSLMISKLQFDKDSIGDAQLEDLSWLNLVNMQTTITEAEIPVAKLPSQITGGGLKLENVRDQSQWQVNGKPNISNRNSSSMLFKATGPKDVKAVGNQSGSSALAELDSMIGLDVVKRQVHTLISSAHTNMVRKKKGLPVDKDYSMHMVFSGSAGTGKTTVARLVGKALFEAGVLPSSKFTEAQAQDLVAGYKGQTKGTTRKIMEQARGGVLFLDEAYTLAPPEHGGDEFNEQAVAEMIADAENWKKDLVVILAGYENEMNDFFRRGNPGLQSRFTNWVEFPDYTPQELVKIMKFQFKQRGVVYQNKKVWLELKSGLADLQQYTNENSGNGRFVRNYAQRVTQARDARIQKSGNLESMSAKQLMMITTDDVKIATDDYRQNLLEFV